LLNLTQTFNPPRSHLKLAVAVGIPEAIGIIINKARVRVLAIHVYSPIDSLFNHRFSHSSGASAKSARHIQYRKTSLPMARISCMAFANERGQGTGLGRHGHGL
jgi:hypothetical protein